MRASTRINKGQFISARYKDRPNAKPAAKPNKPAQAPNNNQKQTSTKQQK